MRSLSVNPPNTKPHTKTTSNNSKDPRINKAFRTDCGGIRGLLCSGLLQRWGVFGSIIMNSSHPLHQTVGALSSSSSNRLRHPRCRKEVFHRSFIVNTTSLFSASLEFCHEYKPFQVTVGLRLWSFYILLIYLSREFIPAVTSTFTCAIAPLQIWLGEAVYINIPTLSFSIAIYYLSLLLHVTLDCCLSCPNLEFPHHGIDRGSYIKHLIFHWSNVIYFLIRRNWIYHKYAML